MVLSKCFGAKTRHFFAVFNVMTAIPLTKTLKCQDLANFVWTTTTTMTKLIALPPAHAHRVIMTSGQLLYESWSFCCWYDQLHYNIMHKINDQFIRNMEIIHHCTLFSACRTIRLWPCNAQYTAFVWREPVLRSHWVLYWSAGRRYNQEKSMHAWYSKVF